MLSTNTLTLTLTLTAALTALTACDTSDDQGTVVIGIEGGVVVSEDLSLEVEVPENALTGDTQVSIAKIDDCVGFSACYEIRPLGTVLAIPATVTYYYGVDEHRSFIDNPAGLTLDGEGRYGWAQLADQYLDPETETLEASILSFQRLVPKNFR